MNTTHSSKEAKRDILLAILLIVYINISVFLTYHNNLLLTGLILIGCAIMFWFWHEKEEIYCFILAMICGTVFEIVVIHFGAWKYANPTFLGIPIWLIPLYGIAILAVSRMAYSVAKL